jgi:hypothetical protein
VRAAIAGLSGSVSEIARLELFEGKLELRDVQRLYNF